MIEENTKLPSHLLFRKGRRKGRFSLVKQAKGPSDPRHIRHIDQNLMHFMSTFSCTVLHLVEALDKIVFLIVNFLISPPSINCGYSLECLMETLLKIVS